MEVKRAGQEGHFLSSVELLGVSVWCDCMRTSKLISCQGSKLGGSRLDFATNLVLSYCPAVHKEVERTGQAR